MSCPKCPDSQACQTDTMHTEKTRKRESDTGLMSRRWQHIHNGPCLWRGLRAGLSFPGFLGKLVALVPSVLLCHWFMVSLGSPHARPPHQPLGLCWGFWDNPAIHVPFSSLLKELSGVCRWEEVALLLPKSSWGLDSTTPHPKLPWEVWLSIIWWCWSLNHPAWAPHWSKYITGKRKHRTPWSGHGKISLPWACVLTHFLLSPPPHARLVTVPGVNSIWQLPCRLTASQGAPGDPQVALLPLLTSVLWATLMATWQAGDRWM